MKNEPAFPACNDARINGTMGMTLRDYFASQFLAGVVVGNDEPLSVESSETERKALLRYWGSVADAAYAAADAMLKARQE